MHDFEAMSPFIAKRSSKHPDVKGYGTPFKWSIAYSNKPF